MGGFGAIGGRLALTATRWLLRRPKLLIGLLSFVVFISMVLQGRQAAITSTATAVKDAADTNGGGASRLDLHQTGHGHEVSDHIHKTEPPSLKPRPSIAIGCAVTSHGLKDVTVSNMKQEFPFHHSLLPSFCHTASPGYSYHFYVAFDHTDYFLNQRDSLHAFNDGFQELIRERCTTGSNYTLHFVECPYDRKPAWAQNDAMMEAYLDDRDYYYRVNDDVLLTTKQWTEHFISALESNDPPNVGVVGPSHKGGNEEILIQDFVHRTHVDIFGSYYPRVFSDWFADDWITKVYEPSRSTKVEEVEVLHTQERGTRYKPMMSRERLLLDQLEKDKAVLNRYLQSEKLPRDGSKVISMCLWGQDSRYTFGCLRNAQLVPVYFPGWTLRVYVEKQREDGYMRHSPVPQRILDKLERLGAELHYVDAKKSQIPPMMWRFLAADDQSVQWFIVRDADGRLSDRDATVVADWMEKGAPFHCVRDHPSHAGYALLGGLWGGKPSELREFITIEWEAIMRGVPAGYGDDMNFLGQVVWPRVQTHAYCHDSVSCTDWVNSFPFPIPRKSTEHLGQVFDAFGNARDEDINIIIGNHSPGYCTLQNETTPKPIPTEATPPSKYVIWNTDCSVGPIRGVMSLLKESDVRFIVMSLSERCGVIGACADDLRVLTSHNGMALTPQLVDLFLREYGSGCWDSGSTSCDVESESQEPGGSLSSQMRGVTHFLCMYPASLCQLYLKFNRSIIIVVSSHRYELGMATKDRWAYWNKLLNTLNSNSRNVIATNNLYDAKYVEHFTGIKPVMLPHVCSYVDATYSPTRKAFLLYPLKNITFEKWFHRSLNQALRKLNSSIVVESLRQSSEKYSFKFLSSFQGIIHIPEQISKTSICEQYYMGLPLFFPALTLLAEWHLQYGVVSELTLNSFRTSHGESSFMGKTGSPLKGEPVSPIKGLSNQTDPNQEHNKKTLHEWLKYADFYQWPHITHFDSMEDLVVQLSVTNLTDISASMLERNKKVQENVRLKWEDMLSTTSKHGLR